MTSIARKAKVPTTTLTAPVTAVAQAMTITAVTGLEGNPGTAAGEGWCQVMDVTAGWGKINRMVRRVQEDMHRIPAAGGPPERLTENIWRRDEVSTTPRVFVRDPSSHWTQPATPPAGGPAASALCLPGSRREYDHEPMRDSGHTVRIVDVWPARNVTNDPRNYSLPLPADERQPTSTRCFFGWDAGGLP